MSDARARTRPRRPDTLRLGGSAAPDVPGGPNGTGRPPAARVVVLAGPSGSGKSHLCARLGLPVLRLDDFYRDGDDPQLPRAFGIVDWDDPASWDRDRAVAAVQALCRDGAADVPVYDLPSSRVVGSTRLDLAGAPLLLAEGIFAAEVVPALSAAGVLADALCLTHRPVVTFARRLARDLHEHRKPPLTLLRRGLALLRAEPRVVARQVSLGAVPMTPREAAARITTLAAATPRPRR